jgi:alanine dehydrogenase
MPGAVARTSTYALTNATLPYILMLAEQGVEGVLRTSYEMRRALNMHKGELTIEEVGRTFDLPFKEWPG